MVVAHQEDGGNPHDRSQDGEHGYQCNADANEWCHGVTTAKRREHGCPVPDDGCCRRDQCIGRLDSQCPGHRHGRRPLPDVSGKDQQRTAAPHVPVHVGGACQGGAGAEDVHPLDVTAHPLGKGQGPQEITDDSRCDKLQDFSRAVQHSVPIPLRMDGGPGFLSAKDPP